MCVCVFVGVTHYVHNLHVYVMCIVFPCWPTSHSMPLRIGLLMLEVTAIYFLLKCTCIFKYKMIKQRNTVEGLHGYLAINDLWLLKIVLLRKLYTLELGT